jgi:hypothetical protein
MTPTLREARSPCATPSACSASTAFIVEAATAGSTSGGRRLTATRRSRQHQFTSFQGTAMKKQSVLRKALRQHQDPERQCSMVKQPVG